MLSLPAPATHPLEAEGASYFKPFCACFNHAPGAQLASAPQLSLLSVNFDVKPMQSSLQMEIPLQDWLKAGI
jgi:hypothetical protein